MVIGIGEDVSDADLVGEPLSRHDFTPMYPWKPPAACNCLIEEAHSPLISSAPCSWGGGSIMSPKPWCSRHSKLFSFHYPETDVRGGQQGQAQGLWAGGRVSGPKREQGGAVHALLLLALSNGVDTHRGIFFAKESGSLLKVSPLRPLRCDGSSPGR